MSRHHRAVPESHKPIVEQILLNMALADLLPPTANQQCLDRAEQTNREYDAWLAEQ